ITTFQGPATRPGQTFGERGQPQNCPQSGHDNVVNVMMDAREGTEVMTFQGTVFSVRELRQRAHQAPVSTSASSEVGLRHDAASNAARCAVLITSGAGLQECWRFGILQTLDDIQRDPAPWRGRLSLTSIHELATTYRVGRN